jgi:hypothetical protein
MCGSGGAPRGYEPPRVSDIHESIQHRGNHSPSSRRCVQSAGRCQRGVAETCCDYFKDNAGTPFRSYLLHLSPREVLSSQSPSITLMPLSPCRRRRNDSSRCGQTKSSRARSHCATVRCGPDVFSPPNDHGIKETMGLNVNNYHCALRVDGYHVYSKWSFD